MFSVIYQATLIHDASNACHVQGQYVGPELETEEKIKEIVVKDLIEREFPSDWGWTREKTRILEFTWTDMPEVPEDIREGI